MGTMKKLMSFACMAFCLTMASSVSAEEAKGEINTFWVNTNGTSNFVMVSIKDPNNTSENLQVNPDSCPQSGYFALESNSPFYDSAISTLLTAKAMVATTTLNVTGCSNNGYPSFNNVDFQ